VAVIDSDSDFGPPSDADSSKNKSTEDDEWLRITGQVPEKTAKPAVPKTTSK